MYDLLGYASMLSDGVRLAAYTEALRRAVRPGDVVVDLGAGPGVFALHAARLGAGKVHGVDPTPLVALGRDAARRAGLDGRVEFHQARLEELELPGRADVIVSDLRGVLPLFEGHLSTLMHARDHVLRPGGTLIPVQDRLRVAVAEAPEVHRDRVSLWTSPGLGLAMEAARRCAANTWCRVKRNEVRVVSSAETWSTLDYASLRDVNAAGRVELVVPRPTTGHGLVVWFDTTLVPGVEFSTAPDQPEAVYNRAFFPWDEPVELDGGARLTVQLRADLVGRDYVWTWTTDIVRPGRAAVRFEQASFFGDVQSLEDLRRAGETYAPSLTEEGAVDRAILVEVDGRRTNGEIARRLLESFPGRFSDQGAALRRVTELTRRLGR